MLKKSRHTDRTIFIKCCLVVCLTISFGWLFGCGYKVLDTVENYNAFLQSYTKYGQFIDFVKADKLSGLNLLSPYAYRYGKSFNGDMAYVQNAGKSYMLMRNGELRETPLDLQDVSPVGEFFAWESVSGMGVRNVYGETVVAPLYDRVEIVGRTVLAFAQEKAYVYIDGILIDSAVVTKDCRLADDRHIAQNNYLYSLHFDRETVGGYPLIDLPENGIALVERENGVVSYANTEKSVVYSGLYKTARRFCEDRAIATRLDNTVVVIDTHENELYATRTMQIGDKNGNYYCYLRDNMYGVLNSEFQDLTGAIFPYVRYEKVVDNYCIVPYEKGERLYSLQEMRFVGETYDLIEYADGLFFCHAGSDVYVINTEREHLFICDSIMWSEGVFTIFRNGQFAYYMREK